MVHIFNLRRKNISALAAAAALVAGAGASVEQYGPCGPITISQYGGLQVCDALKLKMRARTDPDAMSDFKKKYGDLKLPDDPVFVPHAKSLKEGQLVSSGLDVSVSADPLVVVNGFTVPEGDRRGIVYSTEGHPIVQGQFI